MGSVPMSRSLSAMNSETASNLYGQMEQEVPRGKVTPWLSIAELLPFLETGDLVEFNRGLYTHWVVYVGPHGGSHRVVHLTGADNDSELGGKTSGSLKGSLENSRFDSTTVSTIVHNIARDTSDAEVRCDDILDIARMHLPSEQQSPCRINNGKDRQLQALPQAVVADRATGTLGTRRYNLLFSNCEHFATWCRYGSKCSSQTSIVKSVSIGLLAAAASGSVGLGIVGGTAALLVCNIGHQIRNRAADHFNSAWS